MRTYYSNDFVLTSEEKAEVKEAARKAREENTVQCVEWSAKGMRVTVYPERLCEFLASDDENSVSKTRAILHGWFVWEQTPFREFKNKYGPLGVAKHMNDVMQMANVLVEADDRC